VLERDASRAYFLLYRHPADLPRLGARRVRSYEATSCDPGTCACACARTPGGRSACIAATRGGMSCLTAREEWESCRSYRELLKEQDRWSE
jgi:hypothetical protein